MIRLNQVKMPLDATEETLYREVAHRLRIPIRDIEKLTVARRSIDARDKSDVQIVYSLDIETKHENRVLNKKNVTPTPENKPFEVAKKSFAKPPLVVGSGPAGLFAALSLAKAGAKPILIERGDDVDTRTMKISQFWSSGTLDTNSNVQFGEGGAGTFSDGKLNTGTRDARQKWVLSEFVAAGAPSDILISAKPHIGTDYLRHVVRNIRKKICSLGGEVRFRHQLTGLNIENRRITGAVISTPNGEISLDTENIILAIGHSARDTFTMLYNLGVPMTQKAFSVGVRIEHPQTLIDKSQYGRFAGHPSLGAADYKLSAHLKNGRSVYTFCMCPGGAVVAAASEQNMVCTNGMSYFARDLENANSALLVGITPDDFGGDHPLAGVEFQRKLERAAFELGGKNYMAPAQSVGDFLAGEASSSFSTVNPSYKPGVTPCDLRTLFPQYISESLRDGILEFDKRLHGFAFPDAIMTGVESRSSSPVRITRDESLQSEIAGLYPCGEGAGYAGGILSAAVDGIRVAQMLLK